MIRIKKRISSGYIKESFIDRNKLKRARPARSLTSKKVSGSGRDKLGHISIRHRGGGAKRKYRLISTLDEFFGQEAKVIALEYDPNRNAHLALIELPDGQKKYIIAQDKLKVNKKIKASDEAYQSVGDRARLEKIRPSTEISDIQLYPDAKKFIARAAGVKATLMAIEGDYALVKLPSGEIRKIHKRCYASIGQISNPEHAQLRIGRAGRVRHMGIRPSVRGKVMSPRSHPHGGGEGVNPIGLKHPKTPWGRPAHGKKTRRNKLSGKFIVKRAKSKR